ncbi:hypothetical protein J7K07_06320 [Candidatus Bathyarchaeota archaeon]|nr:hypothetical protein [Candidatus Bathyarchaeota archaeon]
MSAVKRKTLFAREDLANRLIDIAKQRGYTLYSMVNEILELAIQAEEAGVNLRKLFEESWIPKKAKKDGFILGPEALWYDMADIAYKNAREEALKKWFEAGVWLAKRYMTVEPEGSFEAFKRSLKAYMWNIPEVVIEEDGEAVYIRMISPRIPESYAILYSAFLEGALETFGYKVSSKDVSGGSIRIKAIRKDLDVEE